MTSILRKLLPGTRVGSFMSRVVGVPGKLAQAFLDARKVAPVYNLSTLEVMREQFRLYRDSSIPFDYYYHFRLFDPNLSWDEKKKYLPPGAGMRQVWDLLTPRKYQILYANKLLFKQYFKASGFPIARLHGVYDPVVGYTVDGRPLKNATDLQSWMQSCALQEFVLKPVEGEGGIKILVFVSRVHDDRNMFVTLSGDKYDAERLAAFMNEDAALRAISPTKNTRAFLIEERIHQHPQIVNLVGQTLCCVRVVTIIARDGTPSIVAAVCKLQPNPIGVDNLDRGGIATWVDLDSGRLGRGRTMADLDYVSVLPNTNIPFVGFEMPYWREVKDLALRAAAAFPWARAIGWDIAISEEGPVLIEGNPHWGVRLIQMPAPYGLMSGELKALYEALRRGEIA